MTSSELDEAGQQFLIQLFEQTGGDPSAQVSMYDVGEGFGLDRDTSSRVAETLIGLQLGSSRPKTAIIREGLLSLKQILEGLGNSDSLAKVRALLGE